MPAGATLATFRAGLGRQFGLSAECTVWSGSRALPDTAQLGGPGLRSGCVLGIDARGPRQALESAVLRLQILSGPDTGRVVALGKGLMTIGRAPDCDIRLSDCDVSRRHLELVVSAGAVSVRDLDTTNGSRLSVDDASPPGPIDHDGATLEIGRYVHLGETVLCIAAPAAPPAVTRPDDQGNLQLNRPPHLVRQLPPSEVGFADARRPQDRPRLPWIAALLAAAASAGLAWYLHNMQYLAFGLLTPLLMLGTSVGERFGGGSARRRIRAAHRQREERALTPAASACAWRPRTTAARTRTRRHCSIR